MFKAHGNFIVKATQAKLPRGWRGRWSAFKWLTTGKPPSPYIVVPVTVGPVQVEVCGGGGAGGGSIFENRLILDGGDHGLRREET